jgi:hypothetical protein
MRNATALRGCLFGVTGLINITAARPAGDRLRRLIVRVRDGRRSALTEKVTHGGNFARPDRRGDTIERDPGPGREYVHELLRYLEEHVTSAWRRGTSA